MDTSPDLTKIVDESVYRAMLKERPLLVVSIAELMRAGQSPATIERVARQQFGDIQMVRNVRHVANHLAASKSL